jgi:hypothetical protein
MPRRQLKILSTSLLICSLVLARPAGVLAQNYSPDALTTAVTITLNASQVIRTIDQRMFGINTAIWDAAFDTTATRSLLQETGVQALRFPGGSLSNEYHWATNTSRDNTWTWATSFDAFASVALTTPAQVFISVNYGSGTPQEAADWVRYANVIKRYGFKYWEIGNENYGSWDTVVTHTNQECPQ